MRYDIAEANSASGLVKKVRLAFLEGWAVQGGVTVVRHSGGMLWVQAMILTDKVIDARYQRREGMGDAGK